MSARVVDGSEQSDPFDVPNGTEQGHVVASGLFGVVFATMFRVSFTELDQCVATKFRTDGGMLNLRRLQAETTELSVGDIVFADDRALVTHGLSHIHAIRQVRWYMSPATISPKKT